MGALAAAFEGSKSKSLPPFCFPRVLLTANGNWQLDGTPNS